MWHHDEYPIHLAKHEMRVLRQIMDEYVLRQALKNDSGGTSKRAIAEKVINSIEKKISKYIDE